MWFISRSQIFKIIQLRPPIVKSIAIIYHSHQGHIRFIAEQIQLGAALVDHIQIVLFTIEQLIHQPEQLIQYDALIWG